MCGAWVGGRLAVGDGKKRCAGGWKKLWWGEARLCELPRLGLFVEGHEMRCWLLERKVAEKPLEAALELH